MVYLIILAPLLGTVVTPLLGRVQARLCDWGAVCFSSVAALAALALLPLLVQPDALPREYAVSWLGAPLQIEVGILLDPVSIVVVNVVALVGFVIMVYCVGYMRDEPGRGRFWMWMNGFIATMALLVLANNLLVLFIGWKLVGLCSWGLIGYYYQDQREYWIGGPPPTAPVTPSQAGLKALVVTGIGDVLMLGGILLLYSYSGTVDLLDLYRQAPAWVPTMARSPGIIALASVLLLAGPLAKSGQFPFHEWLPEAMAGPTPVSALIHAATMVKSGVYLVARLLPVFYYARWEGGVEEAAIFFTLVAWMGALTAFMAATQGMVALELKKVLAYSTVSQIGYMMLALGVAGLSRGIVLEGLTAGLFHLVSHALFKACLFLCAGAVIHAAHSIYIHEMGGMGRHLRLTYVFTGVAALSLMGVPPLPGFWSKDAVLLATLSASGPLFLLALITTAFTSFYTVRCLAMVFHGSASAHLRRVTGTGAHLTDGEKTMRIASGSLAVLIIASGLVGSLAEGVLRNGVAMSLTGTAALPVVAESHGEARRFVVLLSLLFVGIGAAAACAVYVSRRFSVKGRFKGAALLESFHAFLWRRWYIDEFYNRVVARGTLRLAGAAEGVEESFDRLVHRKFPAWFNRAARELAGRMQTERNELVNDVSYVLVFFVLFIALFFFWVG